MATRGSELALAQADWVIGRLARAAGGAVFEKHVVATSGDRAAPAKGAQRLGDGVFVKEIQRALLDGEADLSVHSLKDVPTDPVAGLIVAAVPAREDPREALAGSTLDALPAGARVGTSSPRRIAQLKRLRPDLAPVPIRGNVPTRVARAGSGEVDAVLLAAAGMRRLGIEPDQILNVSQMLPAPGQGALALEVREADAELAALTALIHDPDVHACVVAERRVLRELGGGCLLPVAAYGRIQDGSLFLTASVTSSDGTRHIEERLEGPPVKAMALAKRVARALIRQGARQLLDA